MLVATVKMPCYNARVFDNIIYAPLLLLKIRVTDSWTFE